MSEDYEPKSQSEAEEAREELETPGKIPGEGAGVAEAGPPGENTGGDPESEAIGAGPSGGAETGGGINP